MIFAVDIVENEPSTFFPSNQLDMYNGFLSDHPNSVVHDVLYLTAYQRLIPFCWLLCSWFKKRRQIDKRFSSANGKKSCKQVSMQQFNNVFLRKNIFKMVSQRFPIGHSDWFWMQRARNTDHVMSQWPWNWDVKSARGGLFIRVAFKIAFVGWNYFTKRERFFYLLHTWLHVWS